MTEVFVFFHTAIVVLSVFVVVLSAGFVVIWLRVGELSRRMRKAD